MPGVFTMMPMAAQEVGRPRGRLIATRTVPHEGERSNGRRATETLPLPLTGGGHGRGWYQLPLARAMGAHRG